jgi:cytochrome c553
VNAAEKRAASLLRRDRGQGAFRALAHREVLRALLVCTALVASSDARATDAAAGKAKAEVCAGCHGDNGISQTENIPSLAGQPDQFIQWQLVFFRTGSRKNEQMQPIVEDITNEDIRDIGAYYFSLTPPKPESDDDPGLSKKGEQAANGRRCASCHTDNYAGTKAVARLADQREEYIVKALHDYKAGQRVGGGVAAMADVAYSLNEEEITAVAHYLSHLQ